MSNLLVKAIIYMQPKSSRGEEGFQLQQGQKSGEAIILWSMGIPNAAQSTNTVHHVRLQACIVGTGETLFERIVERLLLVDSSDQS